MRSEDGYVAPEERYSVESAFSFAPSRVMV